MATRKTHIAGILSLATIKWIARREFTVNGDG
jgi:hypothetical protein